MIVKPHILYFRNSFDQRYIFLHLVDFPDGVEFHQLRKELHFESTAQFLANVYVLHQQGKLRKVDELLHPVFSYQNLLWSLGSDFTGSEDECRDEIERIAINDDGTVLEDFL